MRYKALPLSIRSSTARRQVPEPPVHGGRRIRDVIATVIMIAILPAAILIVGRAEASATLSVVGEAVPGSYLTVTGGAFDHPLRIQLLWDGVAAGMPSTQTRAPGSFTAQAQVPIGTPAGAHRLSAVGGKPGGAGGSKRSALGGTTIAEVWVNVASASVPSATLTPIPTASVSVTASASLFAAPASATPTPEATAIQASPPPVIPSPTQAPPTPAPTPARYSFVEEFNGTAVDPARWFVVSGKGISANNEATFDAAHATVSGGYLHLAAERLAPGRWVSGYVDTSRGRFRQQYGIFEARIQIPKGYGFWPGFWAISENGDGSYGPSELDAMEICANPIGTRGGNDASLLHSTIHYPGGQANIDLRTVDLSGGFHTYSMEWRADRVTFYLDGLVAGRYVGVMPQGSMVVALDLAVGDAWCGSSDSSTPSLAEMLVDWVRVRP